MQPHSTLDVQHSMLLQRGADDAPSPIKTAIAVRDYDAVRTLLDAGADILWASPGQGYDVRPMGVLGGAALCRYRGTAPYKLMRHVLRLEEDQLKALECGTHPLVTLENKKAADRLLRCRCDLAMECGSEPLHLMQEAASKLQSARQLRGVHEMPPKKRRKVAARSSQLRTAWAAREAAVDAWTKLAHAAAAYADARAAMLQTSPAVQAAVDDRRIRVRMVGALLRDVERRRHVMGMGNDV